MGRKMIYHAYFILKIKLVVYFKLVVHVDVKKIQKIQKHEN